MHQIGATHAFEQFARQMDGRPIAAGSHIELAGAGFGDFDEICHAVDVELLGFVGIHDHHIRHTGNQGNGCKVFHGIKRHFFI